VIDEWQMHLNKSIAGIAHCKYPALVLLSYLASLQPPFNFSACCSSCQSKCDLWPDTFLFNFFCRLPAPPLRHRHSRPTFLCRGKNHPRPSTPPPAVPIARDWEYNHAHRRRRVVRVDTSSPAIARTFTPCIQAISSRSGVFVVVETTTKIILEHKKFESFLYSPPFCGVSRAVTDHHLCSQRILCSAHARTRTGVH
jgi:hypothetical protein